MKNLILFACVLIVNLSFAQKDINQFSKKILSTNIEESQFKSNTYDFFNLEKQEKLRPMNAIKAINNSEGKFPFYSNTDQKMFEAAITTQKNIVTLSSTEMIEKNEDFVDQLILKILEDKNIDISDFEQSIDFNGDKNVNYYKDYTTDVNKLIVAYEILGEMELQIGKDLNSYLNKILKTEIDKTLQNSINLLALNF
jgi:hypothetical protein